MCEWLFEQWKLLTCKELNCTYILFYDNKEKWFFLVAKCSVDHESGVQNFHTHVHYKMRLERRNLLFELSLRSLLSAIVGSKNMFAKKKPYKIHLDNFLRLFALLKTKIDVCSTPSSFCMTIYNIEHLLWSISLFMFYLFTQNLKRVSLALQTSWRRQMLYTERPTSFYYLRLIQVRWKYPFSATMRSWLCRNIADRDFLQNWTWGSELGRAGRCTSTVSLYTWVSSALYAARSPFSWAISIVQLHRVSTLINQSTPSTKLYGTEKSLRITGLSGSTNFHQFQYL